MRFRASIVLKEHQPEEEYAIVWKGKARTIPFKHVTAIMESLDSVVEFLKDNEGSIDNITITTI